MATIFFTNNSNEGEGSLRAAILSASSGDIIKPDTTKFTTPESRIIKLETYLDDPTVDNVTIDCSDCRITLDGQGAGRCLVFSTSSSTGNNQVWIELDIVNGYGSSGAGVFCNKVSKKFTFSRCRFFSNETTGQYGDAVGNYNNGELILNSCLVYGNKANVAIRTNGSGALYHLIGCTIIGNHGADIRGAESSFDVKNSIIGKYYDKPEDNVLPSQVGFASAMADSVYTDTWSESAFASVDLHLTAQSEYKSGATWATGDVDFDGTPRQTGSGRGTKGAFEFVQQDVITSLFGDELADLALRNCGVYIPLEQIKSWFN